MKLRSFYLLVLLVVVSSLLPTQVKASHAGGGEILYEWISDSTYRFFFKFYRDCTGIPAPATADLCATNPCDASWNQSPSMQQWQGKLPFGGDNGKPVAPGCAQYPTKCEQTSSPIPGFEEWWYSTIVVLGGRCNYWTFAVSINARNISGNVPNGGDLYIHTTFNNLLFQNPPIIHNSSPYFTIKPIPYVCVNTPYNFNNGAIDPDGDSLSTDLIIPLTGACQTQGTPVTYTGTLPNNPFPTGNTFITNSLSGQMSFTPTTLGVYTLTTRVREYRFGKLIGYILRDVQVSILSCSSKAPNVTPRSASTRLDTAVYGCTNQNLNFCYDIVADSPDYRLIAGDNHLQALPAATTAYYNQATDSVRGCFSWTPGPKDTGWKGFIVSVKDSTCKPPGIMLYYTYSIPIYVWAPTRALKDTSICPKATAFLAAVGGKDFVWDVVAGGDPVSTMTCTNCVQPIVSPGITTKYHVLSTINPYCPNSNKDTVTVTVMPAPIFTPHNDTITCPNNPIKLDLKPNPPSGVTYSYKWLPITGLDNDTIPAPISNPTADVTYYVTVRTTSSICETKDTIKVDVLDGFRIYNGDTAICDGQSVDVTGIGDVRYGYKWEPDPLAQANISAPTDLITTITPGKIGKYSYILRAQFATCKDSTQSFNIEVQPIPDVTVNDDTKICFGDTMKLKALVSPADYKYDLTWTPGASLDNAKILDPIFTANTVGEAKLTFIATSTANCSDSDDVILTVFPAEFLKVSNDTAICPDDSVKLSMTAEGVKSFVWSPDVNISNTKGYDPIVWPATTESYYVYGIDTNGCTDTGRIRVTVKPQAILDIPREIKLYPGQSYQVDPNGNCLYFTWFPNVGITNSELSNPILKPEVNTRYIVNAMTEAGCMATDSINVVVMPDSRIDIPNAFAPGRGPNGKLKVLHLGDATLKTFAVYNRWGTKVFETSDINEGWDGTYQNEPQPMGVYIYSIEAKSAKGVPFSKNGNTTLIR
jgi:gliding motility-associated-like protein